MKNRLFELSEDEKSRILNLHESAKSDPSTRKSIDEQRFVPTINKTRSGDIGVTRTKTGGEATISSDVKSSQNWGPNDKSEIEGYLSDENSGWSKTLNEVFWDKIKWWDLTSKNNYNTLLSQEPWVLFNVADEVKYDEDGDDPNANAAIAERVVIIDKGKTTEETPFKPGEPGETWKMTYDRQSSPVDTANFFANNSWAISDNFKNYVNQEIITPLKQIVAEAQTKTGQNPQFYIEDFDIDSSVSRFRNTITNSGQPIPPGTENPDRMSFETLATKRAESALNYIKSELISNGLIPENGFDVANIDINAKGQNGDGSSGPDPYVEGNKLVKQGKYKNLSEVFKDTSFTNPYSQFRYTKIKLKIGMIPIKFKDKTEETEPTPGEEITKQNWEFKFFWEDTDYDFEFTLPKYEIKMKAIQPKPPGGGWLKVNTEDCHVSWWERFLVKSGLARETNPAKLGF